MSIRTIIADDQAALRAEVRAVLADEPCIDVIAEAVDGAEALRLIQSLAPDVAILDVAMPVVSGIEVTSRLCDAGAETKVLALSMHADAGYVRGMMNAGARGYVLKGCAAEELASALRAVHGGGVYLSKEIAAQGR